MANPTITNHDATKIPVWDPRYKDATVNFAGAGTYAAGLIMGRKGVSAGVVTPDGGNTGDGTVTNLALAGGGLAIPGNYNLEVVQAVGEGGVFKLEDPNGNLVADNLEMVAGAGNATDFVAGGLSFTITDGAADFIVGDKFTLNVVDEGQKWVPWSADAVDGSQFASGVLPAEVTATGAGDLLRRMLIGGEVDLDRLSIDAGGAVPESAILSLRNFGIIVREGVVIDELDNQ